ncbi:MAG: hypothetical protein V3T53_04525 [Phycisphaerales bacterium]
MRCPWRGQKEGNQKEIEPNRPPRRKSARRREANRDQEDDQETARPGCVRGRIPKEDRRGRDNGQEEARDEGSNRALNQERGRQGPEQAIPSSPVQEVVLVESFILLQAPFRKRRERPAAVQLRR